MTIYNMPIRSFDGQSKPYTRFWNLVEGGEDTNGNPTNPEVQLYGIISEYSWFDDDVTPKMFKDDLYNIGQGGPVTVRINSDGGDVIAASVMRAILTDYPGEITTRVDGIAASAAVTVALAGDRVLIQDSAYMMIHDPWIGVLFAALDIETLERMADMLKSVKTGIVDTYSRKTGINADRLNRMLADETWMSAREAITLGFADEIIPSGHGAANRINNLLRNYRNVPVGLLSDAAPAEPVHNITEAARLRDEIKLLLP